MCAGDRLQYVTIGYKVGKKIDRTPHNTATVLCIYTHSIRKYLATVDHVFSICTPAIIINYSLWIFCPVSCSLSICLAIHPSMGYNS